MELLLQNSFIRDAKKVPELVAHELQGVIIAIRNAGTLEQLGYSVKKMAGAKNAFRLRLNNESDYRVGFYLQGNTVILSRVLHRKEIYKFFPPKR